MGLFCKEAEETGTLTMIGQGETSVNFPFKPETFHFDIKDDPTDPGPLSCNPVDLDQVYVTVDKHKGRHVLKVKWKVFGVKHLFWRITNY